MLERLTEVQERLDADQERLALLLADAQAAFPPDEGLDEQVFFFRDGMELRLREFSDECRRLAAVERRLQRKLDDAEALCEIEAVKAIGQTDPRLIEKLEEQRRVIRLQQDELDQLYFQRDVLADDAARLKEELEEQEPVDDDQAAFDVVTSGTQQLCDRGAAELGGPAASATSPSATAATAAPPSPPAVRAEPAPLLSRPADRQGLLQVPSTGGAGAASLGVAGADEARPGGRSPTPPQNRLVAAKAKSRSSSARRRSASGRDFVF